VPYVPACVQAGFTAVFADNDPRESGRVVAGVRYGLPLPEAVWRTNHGYDPEFLRTTMSAVPSGDSFTRYKLLHDTIVGYKVGRHVGMLFTTCGQRSTLKSPTFPSPSHCSLPELRRSLNPPHPYHHQLCS